MRWPSPGMVHAGCWTHESKGVTVWQSVSYRRLLGQLTVVKFSGEGEGHRGNVGQRNHEFCRFVVPRRYSSAIPVGMLQTTRPTWLPLKKRASPCDSVASVSQSRPFRNLVQNKWAPRGALIMHRKFKIPLENPLYHSRHVSRVTAGGATGSVLQPAGLLAARRSRLKINAAICRWRGLFFCWIAVIE